MRQDKAAMFQGLKVPSTVTYVGGAKDHETTPQKYALGTDGKPDRRRKPEVPAKHKFIDLKEVTVLGVIFKLNEPVVVTRMAVLKKAKALGWFEIEPGEVQKPKAPQPQQQKSPAKG